MQKSLLGLALAFGLATPATAKNTEVDRHKVVVSYHVTPADLPPFWQDMIRSAYKEGKTDCRIMDLGTHRLLRCWQPKPPETK